MFWFQDRSSLGSATKSENPAHNLTHSKSDSSLLRTDSSDTCTIDITDDSSRESTKDINAETHFPSHVKDDIKVNGDIRKVHVLQSNQPGTEK